MVAWVYGGKKGTYAENTFSPEMKCFKVSERQGSKDAEIAKVILGFQKLTRISATKTLKLF